MKAQQNGGYTLRYAATRTAETPILTFPLQRGRYDCLLSRKRERIEERAVRNQGFCSQTRSLNSLPALKCGTYLAGTFTLSPVLGLRPWRGGR